MYSLPKFDTPAASRVKLGFAFTRNASGVGFYIKSD